MKRINDRKFSAHSASSRIILLLLFPCFALADEPSTNVGFDGPRTLVIGKISDNPQVHMQGLQPLIDYVVARMGDLGMTEGKVLLARDYRQMLSYTRQGKVDWVTETIGSAMILKNRANARFLARRWKFGESEYKTTIFVRADNPIQSMDQLLGHTIAFEHPGSSTGFMIPAVELRRMGLDLALMGTPKERPPAHMIGYLFSGDEVNTATWVHKRLVDAGAISDTDWKRPDQVPPAFRNDLRIIHEGEVLPRCMELVREGLDPVIAARLLEILMSASEDEAGKEVLSMFQRTSRFDAYDPNDWPYIEGLWPDLEKMLSEVN